MESAAEVPPKKAKSRQSLNLQLAECIRQFELPRQFPSNINELNLPKSGSERNSVTTQTKNVQNIISALPLSGKMKFIPNKEVSISENLQKVKLKLPNGKDLGEVKIVLPGQEERLQGKVVTMSKIGQTSEKPVTWTISSSLGENQKPKIKTITRLFTNASLGEHVAEYEDINNQLQVGNDNSSAISTNLKKFPNIDEHDTNEPKIIVHKNDIDVIQKFIVENSNSNRDRASSQPKVISFKKLPGSQKVVVMQRENNQIVSKPLSLKPVTQSSLNNHCIRKKFDKIILKSSQTDSLIKKRDSSHLEQVKTYENKKPFLQFNEDSNLEILFEEKNRCPISKNSATQALPRKNVMVIVPNEATKELTVTSSPSDINNKVVQENTDSIDDQDNEMIIENDELFEDILNQEERSSNNTSESTNFEKTVNNTSNKLKGLVDKFNILRKAVLSVQDANLRAEALKALRDCGIKVKKTVPVKRPTATKVINETATQTHVFSLMKEGEFIEVTEKLESLVTIKQSRKLMKQPVNTLCNNRQIHKIPLEQDQDEFKNNLDKCLEKMFPQSKSISEVKGAFATNNAVRAKAIFKQLQIDFEATRNYDDDGLLGIHRAVIDDNIRDVQKHMLMLKVAKKDIDVYSQDDKTSLELAVEYDVNPQIVKLLLDAGAQPVSSKPIHSSALTIAAKNSSRILPLLFKYINRSNRKLLNVKDSDGLAVIHYLAQRGNLEGMKELLKHEVEVNLQEDRSGRTALFYVVETRNGDAPQEIYNDIAFKLLEYGAVSNIPIFSKHSVLSMIDDVKSHSLKIALNKAVR